MNNIENLERDIYQSHIKTLYQPIFSRVTNSYIAFESLVRIYSSDGNMYPVQEAIMFAEKNNLIDVIFDSVIQNIARDFHSIQGYYLTINISPIQLLNKSNVMRIVNLLRFLDLPLDRIVFEITESNIIIPTKEFYSNIDFIKSSSIRIAVDDFDVGLSTRYLKDKMNLDIVKLDRAFIYKNIANKEKLSKLVADFKSKGYHVVAEGIETKYQEEQLFECGICEFQGFLYSKPIEFESLKEFLALA